MSGIRKQTIQSSIIVYFGFLVGAFNMYLYSKNGPFTTDQFGLTRLFFDFAQNIFAFASLGTIPVLYKFYPYYKDNLPDKKNDLLTWVLVASVIGFILVTIIGIEFEPLWCAKFGERSTLFLIFITSFFHLALATYFFQYWKDIPGHCKESVITNSLKETVMRIITTIFILLYYFKFITLRSSCIYFLQLFLIIADNVQSIYGAFINST